MTEKTIRVPHDPYPNEAWHQTPYVRWATMSAVPSAPPVLQALWHSTYGRQHWLPVETVAVGQSEYERKADELPAKPTT